ncbi:hypothetical protein Q8F55_006188 [Vanrija albida]|uniref:Uncharacterized protein n=1 Tax=Vanrija albida TaxID=181172 RepID=A0ABR3PWD2_9TREE
MPNIYEYAGDGIPFFNGVNATHGLNAHAFDQGSVYFATAAQEHEQLSAPYMFDNNATAPNALGLDWGAHDYVAQHQGIGVATDYFAAPAHNDGDYNHMEVDDGGEAHQQHPLPGVALVLDEVDGAMNLAPAAVGAVMAAPTGDGAFQRTIASAMCQARLWANGFSSDIVGSLRDHIEDLVPAFSSRLPKEHKEWMKKAVVEVYDELSVIWFREHMGQQDDPNGPPPAYASKATTVGQEARPKLPSLDSIRCRLTRQLNDFNPAGVALKAWEKECLRQTYVLRTNVRDFTMLEKVTIAANLIRILGHTDAKLEILFECDDYHCHSSVKFIVTRRLSDTLFIRIEELVEELCKRCEPFEPKVRVLSFNKADYMYA